MKFNIGDIVECTDARDKLINGNFYKILSLEPMYCKVQEINLITGELGDIIIPSYYKSRFKKVNTEMFPIY